MGSRSPSAQRIAVIGGGAFGAMTAAHLAETGQQVTLLERLPRLFEGASANANRLHRGFHYPRHEETARQCARGFALFRDQFAKAILPTVSNTYFIASEGSLTSPDEFLDFCRRLDLPFRVLDRERHRPPVQAVALGVETDEVVYDRHVLRRLVLTRLERSGARVELGADVVGIDRLSSGGFDLVTADERSARFDSVVNCSYASISRLSGALGHDLPPRQYEYAAAAVVVLDWPEPVSLTVMDGPFFSLLPLDGTGRHLLYHVEHSVIARHDTTLLDPGWLDPQTAPFRGVDKQRWFEALVSKCSAFVPSLRRARLEGFLEGPRVVLAGAESTDARPSRVAWKENGYLEVFSGKIDHCLWIAEDVAQELGCSPPS